ncbi:uncharacterized protein [Magallana gigas]|uniref:uncharacterized protein isoform X1 n=1 Tax=Magallana gigas TaxID=29159 RepID=UPI0033418DCB
MYEKKMQRVFNNLNPLFFDPTSDDQVKMRKNVRHKKVAKTIKNLKKINAENVGVYDFLPSWATNAYFDSLHGKKASEEEGTKAGIEEKKVYVKEIIAKARESFMKEALALKVPQDYESLKKDEIDKNMIERRRTMETVHQQLLSSFNSVTEKRTVDNCEKIIAKTKQMMAIHAEIKRMVLLKGLCLEEDNDDSLGPRKLFLFKIEDF